MEFGIFDWQDRGPGSLAEQYEQRLRLLKAADQAGYHCYFLAEHHGTPLGISPSPSVFLAAAAQRTSRIRLGTLVYIVPLYHPLRLAEEICMLDQLSGGRLELGLGRGSSLFELRMMGVDPAETRDRYQEGLEILLMALTTGEVNYQGRYFTFEASRLELEGVQRPYPPLWYPTSNPETIPWVAEQGYNTLWSFNTPTMAETRRRMDLYRRHYPRARHNPARVNPHVAEPKYGIVRKVYVAESDDEARRVVAEALPRFRQSFTYLWETRGQITTFTENLADLDDCLERGVLFAGSPDTVRARLKAFMDGTGGNYFGACFAWGGLSTEQVLRSMQLFTAEVMPALT